MQVPENLRYTKDHEWVLADGTGVVTVGITDYAQNSLGDVTFVDLPKVGATFAAGATFGVVESVKAASDLYMPVAGTVVEINPTLASKPELVNASPYVDAWMIKVKVSGTVADLMSAAEYRSLTGA